MVVESQLANSEKPGKILDCSFISNKGPISNLYIDDFDEICANSSSYYYGGERFIKYYESHDWRSFIYRDYLLYKKLKGEKKKVTSSKSNP